MGPEHAAEFHPDLTWLQAARRVELFGSLRGHVVAVLFWRLACVHSLHALGDLVRLQEQFPAQPFAVVGIHVPHLPAERDAERVRACLRRHGLTCAVALDPERLAAAAYRAEGWPFLVLVDAKGQVRFRGRGEPQVAALQQAVDALLHEARAGGALAAVPFVAVADHMPAAPTGLRFPSRMVADGADRLWLADTGQHRLLHVDAATGRVLRTVGDGRPGRGDGDPERARFRLPQGLCRIADGLLVADTGNHALRLVDSHGEVRTVCGNGERSADRYGGGFGEQQGLCSPVDVCHDGTSVRVAMAGAHQLWSFDPDTTAAMAWLGTGVQRLGDGGEDACFSQPRGLAAAPGRLWVADAGNGAVRVVDLAHGTVTTPHRGLQGPAALVVWQDDLLVADALAATVWRLPQAGGPGEVLLDASHGLVSPEGLLVRGSELWIADAGAHRILAVDLAAADPPASLREVVLHGVAPVARATVDAAVTLAQVSLCAWSDVTLWLRPPAAAASRWPHGTRLGLRASNDSGAVLTANLEREVTVAGSLVRIDDVPIAEPGEGVLRLHLHGPIDGPPGESPVRLRCLLPVRAAGDGALEARLEPERPQW